MILPADVMSHSLPRTTRTLVCVPHLVGRNRAGSFRQRAKEKIKMFWPHGGNPWQNFGRRLWRGLTPPHTLRSTGGGGQGHGSGPCRTRYGPRKNSGFGSRGGTPGEILVAGVGKASPPHARLQASGGRQGGDCGALRPKFCQGFPPGFHNTNFFWVRSESVGDPSHVPDPPPVLLSVCEGVRPLQSRRPKFCQGFPPWGQNFQFLTGPVASTTLRGCARPREERIRGCVL